MVTETYRKQLNIPKEHEFRLVDKKIVDKGSRADDDFYFEEIDASGVLIHKYHVWSYCSKYPPFNGEDGYKKYSADGKLVEQKPS